MAKFIELTSDVGKYLLNIDTVVFVFPDGSGSKIHTTCRIKEVYYCNEGYDYVREQIITLSE